jgi:release factor glutamine methyltransferase
MLMHDALRHAADTLAASGIENPRREARLLAAHILGLPANAALPTAITPAGRAALDTVLQRRAAREPFAYITGTRGFWTIELETSPATLIPRPDSETLIEAARAHFPDRAAALRILDLGTGTGALLLAALTEFPAAFGIGTDLSAAAASLAARNAARLNLAPRAAFLAADWAAPIAAAFDLILCNPPYIASADLPRLMPEVAAYEPASALDGGADGMRAYARLIPMLPALMTPGGLACLELGAGQGPEAAALASAAGFTHIAIRPDLACIGRAMLLTQPAAPMSPHKTPDKTPV